MPTIPTYTAQRNINANVAQPLRDEASAPFQNIKAVTSTLQNITQQWSDAQDVMQYTEAKAKFGMAMADIQVRADADPDFKGSDKYYKEIDKAKMINLQGIANQQVAGKARAEFEYDAQITGIKIGAGFQQKQIAYNQIMVKSNIDTLMQKKLGATTEAEAQSYDLQISDLIANNLQTGTLSYEQADKMLKDSQETSVKYEIYADNSTQEKDSALLKELKKANGKYSFLDPDTRLKMIEESQRRIFQNNQTFKREAETTRDGRFNDIFAKANEGTLTLNDLDAEMKIPEEMGGIPKKQILDIRKSLQSRIKSDLQTVVENNEKAGQYLTFVDNFILDETDRQKGREAIVNAFKDNILSPKEANYLNQLKREAEGIQQLKSREQFMGQNIIPFKNAINAVNDFFTGKKNFTESEKAMAIKSLLSGSAEGVDPMELSTQLIMETTLKKNPAILNLPEEGTLVVDENGFLKIMNNKGEIKDYKASTGE